jgi:hypothetical protein
MDTEPEGARVTLDGVPVGITPMTAAFSRKCDGVIGIDLDGYEHYILDKDKVVNGWVFLNIIYPYCIIVDLITSNQGRYSTYPMYVRLVPKESRRSIREKEVEQAEIEQAEVEQSSEIEKSKDSGPVGSIAIVDIQTPEVIRDRASGYSDVVRAAAIKADRYRVMAIEKMVQLLDEQQYLKLKKCLDKNCLAKFSSILNVKFILFGEIRVLADKYNITLALYNADSHSVQWTDSATAETTGDIYLILQALIRQMNDGN